MSLLKDINKTSKQISKSSENYVNATKEYVELKAFQQITIAFSLLFKSLIIGTLFLISFIILLIEGVVLLMHLFGSIHLALLSASGIIFMISLIIYLFRKPLIESRVIKLVSKTFFSTE